MKRNLYLASAGLLLIALWSRGALAAQADAWKAEVQAFERAERRRLGLDERNFAAHLE